MTEYGYAGKILRVNLSEGMISTVPTSVYADEFLGGRGIGARVYWDEVSRQLHAFHPDNKIVIATGPAAGFTRVAGSRWMICGKSPASDPETFSYANLGGSWGSRLKFAGYDALIIEGSAKKQVYLYINESEVEIRDASWLWGKTTTDTRTILKRSLGKGVRVLAIGPAGENLVPFATLIADEDASGSGGFASVMGSKKLKAIAVYGDKRPNAADPSKLQEITDYLYQIKKGEWDIIPPLWAPKGTRRQLCYGCISGCFRNTYQFSNGGRIKFSCQAAAFYQEPSSRFHNGWNEAVVMATKLCNDYGLDTLVVDSMIGWLRKCYEEGALNDKETGLPLSKIGSVDFIEALVKSISLKEGIGGILALGTTRAARELKKGTEELLGELITARANEKSDYDPRLYIITALLYAVEPRRPIQQLHEVTHTMMKWLGHPGMPTDHLLTHEELTATAELFWGSKESGDFTSHEGKALGAKKIQDREYAKESLILCDFAWPLMYVRSGDSHIGDPTLESRIYSAIVGKSVSEDELNHFGERIFNLQRAILIREGWKGRDQDRLPDFIHESPLERAHLNEGCMVPGPRGEAISLKGHVLEKPVFERMKDEYYQLRGWDLQSGLQTRAKLEELELRDVADSLASRGLAL